MAEWLPMPKFRFIIGLILILLPSLVAIIAPPLAQANPEANIWSRYPIPQKGEAGDWVLTSDNTTEGTGVTAICVAFDGTIYAGTEETLGSPLNGYNLFKSTDDGYSWTPLWKIPDTDKPTGGSDSDPDPKVIALILPQWEYTDTLYLATQYNVYKSTDGGENFATVSGRPTYGSGDTVTNSRLITSFDVTYYDDNYLAVVGSRDADANDYGGVYLHNESKPFTRWADLRVGGDAAGAKYDVLDVAFSPDFADDQQTVALVTDETDTIITTRLSWSDWDAIISDATLSGVASTGGCLAFPADYDSDVFSDKYVQYVGLDAGVYSYMIIGAEKPDSPTVIPLLAPAPVYTMAIAGESASATIVAGLTNGSVIHGTIIAYLTAYTPPAVPTATNACVALGGFYESGYIVYAGTSGANGGFARSVDSGATFALTAFINDDLTTVTNLAVSPNHSNDNTMYMITSGHSGNSILWRTTDGGTTWDAVLTEGQVITPASGSTKTVGNFDKVAISPNFASDTTVFICESGNNPSIWRSTDNGFRFSRLPRKTGTKGSITSWAVVDNRNVLVGDSLGKFYETISHGNSWSPAVTVTTDGASLNSIVLSPDYDNDSTILAGDDKGRVYLSTNGGETWSELKDSVMSGAIFVTFDPDYADNAAIYCTDSNGGVYRYIIGKSTDWVRIDNIGGAPSKETARVDSGAGLAVSDDGTLYATDNSADGEGISRCLNPTGDVLSSTEYPYFERVNRAVDGSLTKKLDGLWLAPAPDVVLWSIFDGNNIYYLEDTLTSSAVLISPANTASSKRVSSVTLSWKEATGAKKYEIWVNTDKSFKGNTVLRTTTPATSYTFTDIAPAHQGIPLYWKVRVYQQEPMRNPWSGVWSFTTALGGGEWSPFTTPDGVAPSPGATNVSIKPAFQWNAADWATGYEFMLARDSGFADVVTARTGDDALPIPAWACDHELDYSTTYFWRVRAISQTSYSEWGVSAFTTMAEQLTPAPLVVIKEIPPPVAEVPVAIIPAYIWVIIGIVAALVIAVIILIVRWQG